MKRLEEIEEKLLCIVNVMAYRYLICRGVTASLQLATLSDGAEISLQIPAHCA